MTRSDRDITNRGYYAASPRETEGVSTAGDRSRAAATRPLIQWSCLMSAAETPERVTKSATTPRANRLVRAARASRQAHPTELRFLEFEPFMPSERLHFVGFC